MYCGSLFVCGVRGTIKASLERRSMVDLPLKGDWQREGEIQTFSPVPASERKRNIRFAPSRQKAPRLRDHVRKGRTLTLRG